MKNLMLFIFLIHFVPSCTDNTTLFSKENTADLYLDALKRVSKNSSINDSIYIADNFFDFRKKHDSLIFQDFFEHFLPLNSDFKVIKNNEDETIDRLVANLKVSFTSKYIYGIQDDVKFTNHYSNKKIVVFSPIYFSENLQKGVLFATEVLSLKKGFTTVFEIKIEKNQLFINDELSLHYYCPFYNELIVNITAF